MLELTIGLDVTELTEMTAGQLALALMDTTSWDADCVAMLQGSQVEVTARQDWTGLVDVLVDLERLVDVLVDLERMLDAREWAVLVCLAQGYGQQLTAGLIGVSQFTVSADLASIRQKARAL